MRNGGRGLRGGTVLKFFWIFRTKPQKRQERKKGVRKDEKIGRGERESGCGMGKNNSV